mgnify:CR=1 FL=1
MKRQDCINAINKLNFHYKKHIGCQAKSARGSPSPCFDVSGQNIFLPRWSGFYSLWIIAHEYAHSLQNTTAGLSDDPSSQKTWHKDDFEALYRECCLILGVFARPTNEIAKEAKDNWYNNHKE